MSDPELVNAAFVWKDGRVKVIRGPRIGLTVVTSKPLVGLDDGRMAIETRHRTYSLGKYVLGRHVYHVWRSTYREPTIAELLELTLHLAVNLSIEEFESIRTEKVPRGWDLLYSGA